MMSWGQVPSLSYSQATLRMSFSAKLCASSRRSFCSSVRVRSTTGRALLCEVFEGVGNRLPGRHAWARDRLTGQSTSQKGTADRPDSGCPAARLPCPRCPRRDQRRSDHDPGALVAPPVGAVAFAMGAGTRCGRSGRAISRSIRTCPAREAPPLRFRRGPRGRDPPDDRGSELPARGARRGAARRRRRGGALVGGGRRLPRRDRELREEVRQLVVARNERRVRQGKDALDVDEEIERQLRELENLGQ